MTGNIPTQAQKFSRIGEVGVMLTLIESGFQLSLSGQELPGKCPLRKRRDTTLRQKLQSMGLIYFGSEHL